MSAISSSAPVFILLFLLILAFPGLAIQGASDGLLLWFHTVLPTLAPAMICTRMLVLTGGDRLLMKPLRPFFHRIFSLSDTGSFILLSGMLCGYPLGPALCAKALNENRISSQEAAYLLAFCSFPSPMFLAGYIPGQFPGPLSTGLLFLGIYAPALFLSRIAGHHFILPDFQVPQSNPDKTQKNSSLDTVLYDVCDTMVLVGAYLMLFSILVCFLEHASWIPLPLCAALCGILEITTGIRQICSTLPPEVCLPACAACAAFGGISGIFQTRSVIACSTHAQDRKNAGFDIRHYAEWKLLHAGFSALILTVLQLVLPQGFPPHS